MFISASFIIGQTGDTQISIIGSMVKDIGYILAVGYFSAATESKLLEHAATWMDLENILWSKRSQTQKTICYVIPFTLNSRKEKAYL